MSREQGVNSVYDRGHHRFIATGSGKRVRVTRDQEYATRRHATPWAYGPREKPPDQYQARGMQFRESHFDQRPVYEVIR